MPSRETRADFWVTDRTSSGDLYSYSVSRILVWKRTSFQDLAIVDTPSFGKALLLDGNWQSCVADEFLYHEPLVHPAMLWHSKPRRVAILGGGEGATLREVLRWQSVDRAVVVDIDGEVVDACKEHLGEMHQGAFADLRTELVVEDARTWLGSLEERFDVIISDLCEPLEDGPAFELFTKEYFLKIRAALEQDGIFALQAGSVAPNDIRLFARVANTVSSVFRSVRPYASAIPSFASPWGFLIASDRPLQPLPETGSVDRFLAENTEGSLRMLDGAALAGLFLISRHIREAIENETRVYTLGDPPRR
jgi:spermidine synthase